MLDRGYGNRRRWISAVITPPYLVGHVMPTSVTIRLDRDERAGLSFERKDGADDATIYFQVLSGTAGARRPSVS
jgi:hypothetical protein